MEILLLVELARDKTIFIDGGNQMQTEKQMDYENEMLESIPLPRYLTHEAERKKKWLQIPLKSILGDHLNSVVREDHADHVSKQFTHIRLIFVKSNGGE